MLKYKKIKDDSLLRTATNKLHKLTENFKIKWICLEKPPKQLLNAQGKFVACNKTTYKFYKIILETEEFFAGTVYLLADEQFTDTTIAFWVGDVFVILDRTDEHNDLDKLKDLIKRQSNNENYEFDKNYHEWEQMFNSLETD